MPHRDDMGDRLKGYERRETERNFLPYLPLYVRIDGRGFSKFTRGLDRPFDVALADVMEATTKRLVESTCAKLGYTQSDEISLVFETTEQNEELLFGGKVQKLCSVLAGMTTAYFITECIRGGGELADRALNRAPHFDARVFQLPTRGEAVNCFIWREKDATKNAISMAARCYYSHKELQSKRGGEMQEMLFQRGINFNDYPVRFKRGVFLQSRPSMIEIPEAQRMAIPEPHRPEAGTKVQRNLVQALDLPILSTIVNREAVVFEAAEPITATC